MIPKGVVYEPSAEDGRDDNAKVMVMVGGGTGEPTRISTIPRKSRTTRNLQEVFVTEALGTFSKVKILDN